jgi:AcrR family transcriptional regulator
VAERRHPALPRGRSSLTPEQVRSAQRERLLLAITAEVARRGYADVTVADVVASARVSRTSFYAQFSDREDCLLAATTEGRRRMFARMTAAVDGQPDGAPDLALLRAGLRAHLEFLREEPAFAVTFYLELASVGRRGVDRLAEARRKLAARTAVWHSRARARHPDWPQVPDEVYRALSAATEDLICEHVRMNATADLPELEHVLVDLHVRLLTVA